ncbi:unnamed protein product [Adineta ricciae]|uniref:Uncharacterized protein n=1 Tax=Adineta ricciae TaxID=249248 RepID=A0A814B1B1_ADIRI|nr:unnamed protein product [Adineta ricciae]CAF1106490.1 unnamed protein product [Adineta ricciae]
MSRTIIITSSCAPPPPPPVTVLYVRNNVRCVPKPSYITVVDQISKPVILTQQIVDYGTPLIIQQPDYYVVDNSPIIVTDCAPRSVVRIGVSSSRCCSSCYRTCLC